MDLKHINEMNNNDLLELYAMLVRTNYYDPTITPSVVMDLRKANINEDMLENIILDRMKK